MRVMGKQEIGQLQPYELVIALMIADLAAIPMSNTGVPLANGLVPIFGLLIAQVFISYAALKNIKFRTIVCGAPSILVKNGQLVESELRRIRYNIHDLLEQLRVKNIANIADVEFAILETGGKLSVIPKSQKRPLIPEDLQLSTKYEGIPTTLIIDGQIMSNNLRMIKLDENWLERELAKFGIDSHQKVLFASLDTNGKLFWQLKSD
jgi:uncharacterized membrane protein YcaP (DUF421 family)